MHIRTGGCIAAFFMPIVFALAGCGSAGVSKRNTIAPAFSLNEFRPNYGGDLSGRYAWQNLSLVPSESVTYRILHGAATDIRGSAIESTEPTDAQSADIRGAVAKWGEALTGVLTLSEVAATDAGANIDFVTQEEYGLATGDAETRFGRTDLYLPDGYGGRRLARAVVRLRADLPERTFRFVALHETGHALGLWGHSKSRGDDVMGNLSAFSLPSFAVPRIELSRRDKNTIRANYAVAAGGK